MEFWIITMEKFEYPKTISCFRPFKPNLDLFLNGIPAERGLILRDNSFYNDVLFSGVFFAGAKVAFSPDLG
jgi:hypothetical protein